MLISDSRYKKPHIAKITIDNIITQDSFRYEKLEELSQNKNTKAVIALINSPGGTVVGGETLYKSIKSIAQNKPIISVMGEVATSAAYMASLGSNYIFVQEGTITGSVGVLVLTSEITELAKKIGVSTEIIKSGDLKASPSPLEKMTPKAREQMEKIVKEISKNFIDLVKKERMLDNKKIQLISDGRIFTGQSALQIGLVDAIGNIKEAKEYLKIEYNITKLPLLDFEIIKKEKLVEKFLSSFAGNINASKFLNLQGLISIWIPNI
jgi:protease-4